ncbi:carboxylating nicotinate-nucleotide diphosphorylase [Psychrobacter frigidicola]|uniref:Probable nicotinate-nucleotide pyrophosphorylase [carboxylating] n=1 Tax=Psychrobacter frigidicola TaxID=45611 RepID=A0A5C7A219_9GAMM|nr:carboxylating nicotinate-nucleotide diphosphorylase [Psychrobacter frigidicola]TXD97471.1 carboxylating nicotinate-nucleotide diphosphorylase [Psychrobacter frigidicola]
MTDRVEPALDEVLLKPLVEVALIEDLGRRGDVTSQATIPADMQAQLQIKARQAGVICGMDLARLAFALVDAQIEFIAEVTDGETVAANTVLATVRGNARHLLTAERTALNFMTHLSGIATATKQIVDSVAEYPAHITCTRKTIPGLRTVQKYAVRCGGGRNHRLGLDDAILIKDNHIAIAGDITTAIKQAQDFAGHLIPIEVEVDTLAQLKLALAAGVNLVLLDNMSPEILQQAVAMCKGRTRTEASGGITPETVQAVAKTGVDFIAMGYLTHSTTALDIGLDFSA